MKKRDIGILIGLGVVVILVAVFLIITPKRTKRMATGWYRTAHTEYPNRTAPKLSASTRRSGETGNGACSS